MTRIKVAHVITSLDLGGAQQNTLYTASHLDCGRFDCLLAAGEGGILDEETKLDSRLRVRWIPSLVRDIHPAKDLLALLELTNLFLEERPRVVHTHSSKAGVLGRLAAWLAGVGAVVHTYHGFGFHEYQPPWIKDLYLRAERLCARLTRALVFVSKANWDYAKRHGLGRPEDYVLIRSGVKLSQFPAPVPDRAAKKASLGLGRHKPLVSSIGNLKPQKNPGDFVAMAQKVSAELPDAEFLFIGDGPLKARLEFQIMASGLSHRLALPGWRRDAAEWLAVSDVFVLTSLWEGLPRALVEAMKSGLPPVCYATDGVADLIEDGKNGYLVPAGNVSSLAQRVTELLKDPELRRRLGERASQSVGSEFDIDLMVRAQERLYESLLGPAGRGRG